MDFLYYRVVVVVRLFCTLIVKLYRDGEDYLTKKFNLMINEAKINLLRITTDVAI